MFAFFGRILCWLGWHKEQCKFNDWGDVVVTCKRPGCDHYEWDSQRG